MDKTIGIERYIYCVISREKRQQGVIRRRWCGGGWWLVRKSVEWLSQVDGAGGPYAFNELAINTRYNVIIIIIIKRSFSERASSEDLLI